MQYQWLDHLDEKHYQDFYTLYSREWWTKNRSYNDVIKMLKHSDIIIGCCNEQGRLIGFARVLTDYTFKALIFDVIIDEAMRGQGLGQALVERILHHFELRKISSFELYCPDRLVPFYEKQGFVKGASCLMFRQA